LSRRILWSVRVECLSALESPCLKSGEFMKVKTSLDGEFLASLMPESWSVVLTYEQSKDG